jgi:hypothetical protein
LSSGTTTVPGKVAAEVAVAVGVGGTVVAVGGAGVAVGGTRVAVGGTTVGNTVGAVVGNGVAVGAAWHATFKISTPVNTNKNAFIESLL